jgi:hypothetical protein
MRLRYKDHCYSENRTKHNGTSVQKFRILYVDESGAYILQPLCCKVLMPRFHFHKTTVIVNTFKVLRSKDEGKFIPVLT